jgi:hypothetical protein
MTYEIHSYRSIKFDCERRNKPSLLTEIKNMSDAILLSLLGEGKKIFEVSTERTKYDLNVSFERT